MIITAKQAFQISSEHIDNNTEMEKIYKTIKKAAEKGEYQCQIPVDISTNAVQILENQGYEVLVSTFYRDDQNNTLIMW